MTKTYADLTEQEQDLFIEHFNLNCTVDLEDEETGSPWCAPWTWCPEKELLSDYIPQAALLFFLQNKNEIEELKALEEEYQD